MHMRLGGSPRNRLDLSVARPEHKKTDVIGLAALGRFFVGMFDKDEQSS